MDSLTIKVIALVLLVVLTMCFGLVPLCLRRFLHNANTRNSPSATILSYLNCFAGGVFMGTAFTHLLPDTHEALEAVTGDFPLAEFIAGCGFFLVMILERAFIRCCQRDDDENVYVEVSDDSIPKYGTFGSATTNLLKDEVKITTHKNGIAAEVSFDSPKVNTASASSGNNQSSSIASSSRPAKCHSKTVHSIRALVLLLALSLHTVFEGLALGLQETTNGVLSLLLAISIHKCIIAFTLGLQLTQTQPRGRVILFMALFAFMSALGVGVGIGVTNIDMDEVSKSTTEGVLQGIATGTFIYVTFFEVLQKELGNDNELLKVIPAIAGFGIMSALTFLE